MRMIVCSVALLVSAAGQSFEVASIKPAPSPDGPFTMRFAGGPGTPDPGLFTTENWALSGIVMLAYGLPAHQFSGPSWMDDARFNMSAKVPEGVTREQFNRMLQNFLADRFKLKFHYEKKGVAQYTLIVAKNGAKLKAAAEPSSPGRLSMSGEGSQEIMHATAASMAQLAGQLQGELHQPVQDATGLKGSYDFTLNWAPGASTEDGGSPIFEALQKQLGLKLEQKKIIVDVLVVDHAERTPSEN
jgi:uncharacterized protein (TIGR03435 family)